MTRTCPYCSSSEIDEDPTRGEASCMDCGSVLEESRIVSDVQFQEIGGGHQVIGQFVGTDGPIGNGVAGQPKPESREVTYYKGKKLIQEIASQLRINNHCISVAHNFYKMAVNMNLTRGRVRVYVVTACLYMTCRLEGTSHLLLDFSDVTQVNVFDLGRTLNFLTRSLKINLPTTDPCLYVFRFASMLDFGDKLQEIVSLATRIVQRMKLDWISTGRRPTGICGAALLLAARAFNINRAVSDIVKVVNISETVVRKRLDEFATTASGNLTIDEFKVVDLEDCEDPPAYQEARVRRLRDNKRQEEIQAEQVVKEFGTIHEELENAIKDKMKRSSYGAVLTGQTNDVAIPELQQAQEFVQPELIDEIYNAAEGADKLTEEEQAVLAFQQQASRFGPTLDSLGITRDYKNNRDTNPSTSQTDQLYNDFEEIDDAEIDAYILTDQESKMKAELWTIRNGAHMIEMEKKRKIKEEEEAKERENPKKKRRTFTKRPPINASNHNEAMYQVIQEKRLSTKINYDMLKDLGGETTIIHESEASNKKDVQPLLAKETQPIVQPPQPIVQPIVQPPQVTQVPQVPQIAQVTTQIAPVVQSTNPALVVQPTQPTQPTKPKAAPQRYKHAKVMPTVVKRAAKKI